MASAAWATSQVRPWTGTFADVDRAARSLATELRARGAGPGRVVVMQLPNWVEAGITFWAAAYLGAVVVPVVHFYGAKEVEYIVRATEPDVVVTADRFGHADHLATWGEVLGRHPVPLWLVVGDTPRDGLPAAATPFASLLDAPPLAEPVAVDPDDVRAHLASAGLAAKGPSRSTWSTSSRAPRPGRSRSSGCGKNSARGASDPVDRTVQDGLESPFSSH